ncbi:MAG: class I SAM-dependent methyltransferase [Acidimicrobiales bacterium]
MTDTSRWMSANVARGEHYEQQFERLAASGIDVHGEASFVSCFAPATVLDAGCGTGRVAIELARRGVDVVGVDLDPAMLEVARRKAPELDWRYADLATLDLGRRFDLVVMAGNVLLFVSPGAEAAVVERMAAHLAPGGRLVTGFRLGAGLSLDDYDAYTSTADLTLESRFATWERSPFSGGGDYAVSVHRAAPGEEPDAPQNPPQR